jgi:hypothetical protein
MIGMADSIDTKWIVKIRSKARKYESVIVFASAVIVFVMYIVKENMRDSAREAAARIDQAQSVFIITEDLRHVAFNIRAIQRNIRVGDAIVFASMRDTMQGSIASAEQLARAIGDESAIAQTEQFRNTLTELLNQGKMEFDAASDAATQADVDEHMKQVEAKVRSGTGRLEAQIRAFLKDLMSRAAQRRKMAETRSRRLDVASSFVYGFAFVFGLFAKLCKVETL